MCTVLDYPHSTYYDKLKEKPEGRREKENRKLQEDTSKIYNDSNRVYGAPKIQARVQRHEKAWYKIDCS